ncbi:MAG: ABC transporter substrate-binding protein, partial [Clostridiales Family XIII bacterium]|nr:ABC transporter substrate-binding protein [Clostridiales Family XIII bacterium]
MQMKNCIILTMILSLLIALTACSQAMPGQGQERERELQQDSEQEPASQGGGASAAGGSGATVTDAAGATFKIPSDASEIKIASVYGVAVPFIVALGLSGRTVAVNPKSVFWKDNVSGFKDVPMVGRGSVDLEKLAAAEPGVLVHRTGDAETVAAVERLKIPVLCISAEDIEGVSATLELIGAYCGADARAEEVKAYLDTKFDMIEGIVSTIPESERRTALVLGSETGRVAGGDMLQNAMLRRAGATDIMGDVKNNGTWSDIGTENVFAKNPDYIFCTSSARLSYDPDKLSSESAWSAMKAVKNGHV